MLYLELQIFKCVHSVFNAAAADFDLVLADDPIRPVWGYQDDANALIVIGEVVNDWRSREIFCCHEPDVVVVGTGSSGVHVPHTDSVRRVGLELSQSHKRALCPDDVISKGLLAAKIFNLNVVPQAYTTSVRARGW